MLDKRSKRDRARRVIHLKKMPILILKWTKMKSLMRAKKRRSQSLIDYSRLRIHSMLRKRVKKKNKNISQS